MSAESLYEAPERLFASGDYSDMRVIDRNGHIYHLHRFVLCGRNRFFRNAMKEDTSKEGYDNTVTLPDDDPTAVKALLQFLYTDKYSRRPAFTYGGRLLLRNINICLIADKYLDANERGQPNSLSQRALEEIAKAFSTEGENNWEGLKDTLPSILQAIFSKVPNPSLLRDILIEGITDHIAELLQDEYFRDAIEDIPSFGRDLLAMQAKRNEGLKKNIEGSSKAKDPTRNENKSGKKRARVN